MAPDQVADAVETIVDTYLGLRSLPRETFLEAEGRVGVAPSAALATPGERADRVPRSSRTRLGAGFAAAEAADRAAALDGLHAVAC